MLNVMLLDDEENAIELLNMMLTDTGRVAITGEYLNPTVFLEDLQKRKAQGQLPHAVFIDIEMPEIYGLTVAERVYEISGDIQVVFVTAYSEYAVQAFELHALDYILKPVNRGRIAITIARVEGAVHLLEQASSLKKEREVRIQCLGEFAIYREGEERVKWRTVKSKEICAYLLHEHNRLVTTDTLLELFFNMEDSEKARIYLYTTIYYVRKIFKAFGFPGALQKLEDGYLLNISGMRCDYLELLQAPAVSAHTRISVHNVDDFESLIELYQGDYFCNMDQLAFLGRREELRQLTVQLLRLVKAYYQAEGETNRMMTTLVKIIALAPDSEQDAWELIQLYAEQGKRAQAMSVYQKLMLRLDSEYGIRPSGEFIQYVQNTLK
ncbi:response regulator [Paenibacillus sp. HB172176]|uniref:response regulator n=1 Tax=Paenibacillus sp. HB172176 TaxID=2493690 RepID=UPI00143912D0|nr:response regulator [Paenibacillus sp. HB172176]